MDDATRRELDELDRRLLRLEVTRRWLLGWGLAGGLVGSGLLELAVMLARHHSGG